MIVQPHLSRAAEKPDAPSPFLIVSPQAFAPLVQSFTTGDDEAFKTSIPNSEALAWMSANVPRFDCPDQTVMQTYWYRWWSYRKHLRQTPEGWIVTEFLPDVPWAGKHNSISCAAGHHLYEGRWLRDPRYMADYARFWFHGGGEPRRYSFWGADSVHAVALVTGDKSIERSLLPDLIASYSAWEKSNQDASGLFHQIDDRDGMEYSLGGSGYRPSINAYQYGDAMAIAQIADDAGQASVARDFRSRAAKIKTLVQRHLWNTQAEFFETAPEVDNASQIKKVGVREQIGYIPWYFNLPDPSYAVAWKQLLDPHGFAAPFGPTTAERRSPGFMHAEQHDCLWNGPSWPYATTQTLVAMANLLNNDRQSVVTKADYFDLLESYARSQQKDGHPWVAEDLDADTGKWIVDLPRSVYYNHSGFGDLVITGLVGLRPGDGAKIVVSPLIPGGKWDWFCLDGIRYRGHDITILWDKTGKHYGHGKGLQLFVDRRRLAHRNDIGRMTTSAAESHSNGSSTMTSKNTWTKYAGNPVLGGALGTCFDISVIREGQKYRMYFSWRPKASIARTESLGGIHWSEPQIVLAPAITGWEDDINRPCIVKRSDGYHLWYTGQVDGRSKIGYATSADGVHFTRLPGPVLVPEQPWEKVAVMCPDVLWDEKTKEYRMWYSGGEQYEPDAIGYAVSADGAHWTKRAMPIFEADPKLEWEQHKVTACQVVYRDGWHIMFYVGFRDVDHAAIGIARSRDGVTDWERCPQNPIVAPTFDSWDADACYKPSVHYDGKQWRLWYNGRRGALEQIGLVTKDGADLGF